MSRKLSEGESRARQRARSRYAQSVLRGEIVRPTLCSRCNQSHYLSIEGHHTDYSRPLEVVWLCRPCHAAEHHANGQHIPMVWDGREVISRASSTIPVYARVSSEFANEVRRIATASDRTVGWIVRKAVEEWVKRQKVKTR